MIQSDYLKSQSSIVHGAVDMKSHLSTEYVILIDFELFIYKTRDNFLSKQFRCDKDDFSEWRMLSNRFCRFIFIINKCNWRVRVTNRRNRVINLWISKRLNWNCSFNCACSSFLQMWISSHMILYADTISNFDLVFGTGNAERLCFSTLS